LNPVRSGPTPTNAPLREARLCGSGFTIGTSTAYRYIREALDLLAAMATTLAQAIEVAPGRRSSSWMAPCCASNRVGMASGHDRAFYSGKHKANGLNVQIVADPIGRLQWISPCAARSAPRHGRCASARDHRCAHHR
jgi:hypothetical protein